MTDDLVLEKVEARLSELRKERDQAMLALKEANAMVKKYEGIVRILTGSKKKNNPKVSTGRRLQRKPKGASYNAIFDVFKNNPTMDLAASNVATAAGVQPASANSILKRLEHEKLIVFTHKGGTTGSTKFYKLAGGPTAFTGVSGSPYGG
jgi:hypothetical protein